MQFRIEKKEIGTKARTGILKTDHGEIKTPIFMPVGTAGAVKALSMEEVEDVVRAQIILGNTYHLYLRPGMEILEAAGGIHRFNTWKKPILTDSGGYQVYSLSEVRKISEEGVAFRSHIDGSRHFFTPERAIDIQRSIGGDIMMAFDECTPYPCDKDYAKKSMEMTHRWLHRCIRQFEESDPLYDYEQALFPIVQGSVYPDLRKKSAEVIAAAGMPGNAIGGLSVGEPPEMMYEMTEIVCNILPEDKPRYLMGVGTPANILESIHLGVDLFDCVMPTRNGRNGMLFTHEGIINIKNKKWEKDFSPIDPEGPSEPGKRYSRAYLRHLFQSKEILGMQLASMHNLSFYLWLVEEARKQIEAGNFVNWKSAMARKLMTRL